MLIIDKLSITFYSYRYIVCAIKYKHHSAKVAGIFVKQKLRIEVRPHKRYNSSLHFSTNGQFLNAIS